MKKTRLWISLAVIIFCYPLTVQSQQADRLTLNTISPSQVQKVGNNANIYFSLNKDFFESDDLKKGVIFDLETGAGNQKSLVLLRKKSYMPGTVSIIAADEANPQNKFVATFSEGRMNGAFHESHQNSLFFSFDNEQSQHFLSSTSPDSEDFLGCAVHDDDPNFTALPQPKQSPQSTRNKNGGSASQYFSAPLTASVDDSITIDLMIVYTNAAESWASSSNLGSINGVIASALTNSQVSLDNSNLAIELRLVHAYKIDYDEENDQLDDSSDRLTRLTQNPANPLFGSEYNGYMEGVHELREQYGADVVSMLAKIDDTGGIGWRLGSSSGSPDYAFNLNRVQQVGSPSNFTLIHEIGHNMGNAHSRTQAESPAKGSGGLYHYSAGYQNVSENFHTIMAYADGLQQAPLFSSPDLSWNGVSAGSNNNQSPQNNARSMREIKRTFAAYQPSIESAPVIAVSTNSIEVEMNREDEFFVPLDISNSGGSALVWDVDFDFPVQTVSKMKSAESQDRLEPATQTVLTKLPVNYSADQFREKNALAAGVLYSTSFESGEGFPSGAFSGIKDWRALSDSEFEISSSNPKSGGRHLRINYDGEDNTQFISAPFFGYQLFGKYEVTFDFSVSSTTERFDVYMYDAKSGNFASGIVITQGTIYAADINEEGGLSFFSTTATVLPNVYGTLRVVFNPDDETIEYYYKGIQIASNGYIGGKVPSEIQFLHFNEQLDSHIDVDNFEIEQLETPYSWLNLESVSGVTFEEDQTELGLTFNTKGMSAGTHETILQIRSNDPGQRIIEIPVTLEILDVVSSEIDDTPRTISLDQNYPNPFNPVTTINYTLKDAENVQLNVFNIQGQKVATLINQRQTAGDHRVEFDASNLSSGIYIYRLKTASQTLTRQMVLIK
ncbi:MAG: zinc-dependent metalloprotease [Balneolaceae bacterium]